MSRPNPAGWAQARTRVLLVLLPIVGGLSLGGDEQNAGRGYEVPTEPQADEVWDVQRAASEPGDTGPATGIDYASSAAAHQPHAGSKHGRVLAPRAADGTYVAVNEGVSAALAGGAPGLPPRKAGKRSKALVPRAPYGGSAIGDSSMRKAGAHGKHGKRGQVVPPQAAGGVSEAGVTQAARQPEEGTGAGQSAERQVDGSEAGQTVQPDARAAPTPVASRPHIFIFLADDLLDGEHGIGFTGNAHVATPHIDAFASEAIEFSRMYATIAMCAPSRAAIYTGLQPFRNGVARNHGFTPNSVTTLHERMIALDYTMVMGGKIHVRPPNKFPSDKYASGLDANRVDATGLQRFIDNKREAMGWSSPTDTGEGLAVYVDKTILWGDGTEASCQWQCTCHAGMPGCWQGSNGAACESYTWDSATKRCQLYRQKANAPGMGPWCLVFSSNEPHGGHEPDVHAPGSWVEDFAGMTLPEKWPVNEFTKAELIGMYNDINKLDREFKMFHETIQHNFPADQKSVTIFTSDHGGKHFGKWSCYEAGLKVPFYLQANGVDFGSAGRRINHLLNLVDLAPTFVQLAGGTVLDEDFDGRSLVPLLSAPVASDVAPLHQYNYGIHTARGTRCVANAYPIRSISDGRWKYIHNFNAQASYQVNMINSDPNKKKADMWQTWLEEITKGGGHAHWVRFFTCRPTGELYDLQADPNEMTNLADQGRSKGTIASLQAALAAWMVEQGDNDPLATEMKVPAQVIYTTVGSNAGCDATEPVWDTCAPGGAAQDTQHDGDTDTAHGTGPSCPHGRTDPTFCWDGSTPNACAGFHALCPALCGGCGAATATPVPQTRLNCEADRTARLAGFEEGKMAVIKAEATLYQVTGIEDSDCRRMCTENSECQAYAYAETSGSTNSAMHCVLSASREDDSVDGEDAYFSTYSYYKKLAYCPEDTTAQETCLAQIVEFSKEWAGAKLEIPATDARVIAQPKYLGVSEPLCKSLCVENRRCKGYSFSSTAADGTGYCILGDFGAAPVLLDASDFHRSFTTYIRDTGCGTTPPTPPTPGPETTPKTSQPVAAQCSSQSGNGRNSRCLAAGCVFDKKTKVCSALGGAPDSTKQPTPAGPTAADCSSQSGNGRKSRCQAAGCVFDKETKVCSALRGAPDSTKQPTPAGPTVADCASQSGNGRKSRCLAAGCVFDKETKVCSALGAPAPAVTTTSTQPVATRCSSVSGSGKYQVCQNAGCQFDKTSKECVCADKPAKASWCTERLTGVVTTSARTTMCAKSWVANRCPASCGTCRS